MRDKHVSFYIRISRDHKISEANGYLSIIYLCEQTSQPITIFKHRELIKLLDKIDLNYR